MYNNDVSTAKSLGFRIRELRKLRKMTQEQLAEAIDSTGSYVGRLERGETNVQLHTLEKIAEALEVNVSALFDEELQQVFKNEVIRETVLLMSEQNESRQKKALNILKELYKPDS
ncbi:XRE family transcriptional regulator [Robertmurraya siralis]|uniref:XRE family transcriptional regulator n=1 Tax=Robertmurraya siralis TaxID=77777 RepID=A0A919WIF2_9BACI|nr:helix-turn-helix transcriptional regulator [Robertmurraya siralis]PAE20361.1 transcriptional regulator [Bacillus sp. 7504-2]GIN62307.1 XRE family transcriptional regulator [Robertmurraya siralis]